MRLLLGGVALAVVAVPFLLAWQQHHQTAAPRLAPQAAAPDTAVTARDRAGWRRFAARMPRSSAPVVLAYHDVREDSASRYTVTPRALDRQLAALAEAGYRTLSTEEFTRYLRTGSAPPRSVYLTFDDGTHGLWTRADRILARYGMRAASYLVTGRVDRHRPYYLSWREVSRMADSGRWDFQAHTHDLHRRVPIDASGAIGSALTHRVWRAEHGRLETGAEYHRRVRRDLDRSLREFADHGLPRPRMFALPFSEQGGLALTEPPPVAERGGGTARTGASTAGRVLRELLRERFDAVLTNRSRRPLPASRRAMATGSVQRLEVTRSTTARELLAAVERWSLVSPGDGHRPLQEPDRWVGLGDDRRPGLARLTGLGPYPPGADYVGAAYRPIGSSDWSRYTVTALVGGLSDRTRSAGLTVRSGSADPVVLRVGRSHAALLHGSGADAVEVANSSLTAAPVHELTVTVRPGRTTALVDGRVAFRWRTPEVPPADLTGGLTLNVRREQPGGEWPYFADLTVRDAGRSG